MSPSKQHVKRRILWKRALNQGWKQLIRDRHWFLTVGTLTGVCILFQLLLLSYIGIEGFTTLLQEKTNIRLELNEDITQERISQFISEVEDLPYIDRVQLVTAESTYELMKQRDPSLIQFLEEFNLGNPFPQTIQVQIASLNDYETFTNALEQEQWRGMLAPSFSTSTTEQETYIRQTLAVSGAISRAILGFIVLALAVLMYIIVELIRSKIVRKHEEIVIQRLCGAMHFYILLPFITEICLVLLLAVSLSIIVMLTFTFVAPLTFSSLSTDGILHQLWLRSSDLFTERAIWLVLVELLCIPLIAWFGTWLGSYKMLHTRHLGLHRH